MNKNVWREGVVVCAVKKKCTYATVHLVYIPMFHICVEAQIEVKIRFEEEGKGMCLDRFGPKGQNVLKCC